MTTRMGIREVARNFTLLDKYDYIEIEDKKTHKLKGIFVSERYMDEIRKMFEKKANDEKKRKLDNIMKYVGKFEMDDRFKRLEKNKLKTEIAKAKCGL